MKLRQLTAYVGEVPREGKMQVPARFYVGSGEMGTMRGSEALKQLVAVAHLPGIVRYALAMPDIHAGYGFPIGGVAALDAKDGAVSPGGVGYDINCGVRLIATGLAGEDVEAKRELLVRELYRAVPVGVGASRAIKRLGAQELRRVLRQGAAWAVGRGYALGSDDLERCEDGGFLEGADPGAVSARALERGAEQVGTLGGGNHFIELGIVEEVYAPEVAARFRLQEGGAAVMIHCGSRGLGHQVCDDALRELSRGMHAFGPAYAQVPDRQLACAPIESAAGRKYLASMEAAANFAWANRQVIMGLVVDALCRALQIGLGELSAQLVYDVCHNIAKREEHLIEGSKRSVLIHRKGATRAFAPGDKRLPEAYRAVGQPVIVPGDMGRCSYVLVGKERAMTETFGSACHGAGRLLSRHQALKRARGRRIDEELRAKGVEVISSSRRTLGEEMSDAYKDVSGVVEALVEEGIVAKVARLRPVGVIKG